MTKEKTKLRELYNRISSHVSVIESSLEQIKRVLADLEEFEEKPLEELEG